MPPTSSTARSCPPWAARCVRRALLLTAAAPAAAQIAAPAARSAPSSAQDIFAALTGHTYPTNLTALPPLQNITVSIKDGSVYLIPAGDSSVRAKVIAADIEGDNGVVHLIDTVLFPKLE